VRFSSIGRYLAPGPRTTMITRKGNNEFYKIKIIHRTFFRCLSTLSNFPRTKSHFFYLRYPFFRECFRPLDTVPPLVRITKISKHHAAVKSSGSQSSHRATLRQSTALQWDSVSFSSWFPIALADLPLTITLLFHIWKSSVSNPDSDGGYPDWDMSLNFYVLPG
jgi:hypothetical protein